MNERRLIGAIAGSLVGGLAITAMMIAGERKSGKPSELIELERTGAYKLGVGVPLARLPDAREQAVAQGAHLLLSAAAGAAFVATVDEDVGLVPAGVGFGLAFYAIAHWIAGPLLGLKRPEWQSDAGTIGMHTLNHIGFGLVTAAGARLGQRR